MSSIRDVAKEAGVGVGTVSRALNKTGYVSITLYHNVLSKFYKLIN